MDIVLTLYRISLFVVLSKVQFLANVSSSTMGNSLDLSHDVLKMHFNLLVSFLSKLPVHQTFLSAHALHTSLFCRADALSFGSGGMKQPEGRLRGVKITPMNSHGHDVAHAESDQLGLPRRQASCSAMVVASGTRCWIAFGLLFPATGLIVASTAMDA